MCYKLLGEVYATSEAPPHARGLLAYIAHEVPYEQRSIDRLSLEMMQRATGMGRRTVIRLLQVLEIIGELEIEHAAGRKSRYRVPYVAEREKLREKWRLLADCEPEPVGVNGSKPHGGTEDEDRQYALDV